MLVASALQVCSYFVLIDFWPCLVNPPSSSCFKNTLFRFLAMTMNRKPGVLPSAPNTVFPTQTELSGQTAQENRHGALVADKHFRHGWAELRCATWWVSKTWYECACSVVCDSLQPAPPPPWTAARQAPLSIEFSRQEYWSGLPFPSPLGMRKRM